jgi:beta-lactamase class A
MKMSRPWSNSSVLLVARHISKTMPPHYYYAPKPSAPRRRNWRPFLGAVIVGVVGLLTVQIVSYATHSHATSHIDPRLQQAVTTWASQQSFESSVYVEEVTGERRAAAHNEQTFMVTASTYKLFVAYAVLHQAELGQLSLSVRTRTGQSAQATLNKMILQSDNASGEALGFLVGWNTVDALAANAGATHTTLNNYDSSGNATNGDKRTTVTDLALLLSKLQQGSLLDPTDTQMLLGLLKNQAYRERIPAGVPNGIAVADKPGWLPNVENDAGIVYGPKSAYVLVVMTTASVPQPLANLSQIVYNQLEV